MYFIESKYLFKCTYIQGVERNVSDKSLSDLITHQMIKKNENSFNEKISFLIFNFVMMQLTSRQVQGKFQIAKI